MRPGPWTRAALHLANLLAIAFFLLPIVAVLVAALQSEKACTPIPAVCGRRNGRSIISA